MAVSVPPSAAYVNTYAPRDGIRPTSRAVSRHPLRVWPDPRRPGSALAVDRAEAHRDRLDERGAHLGAQAVHLGERLRLARVRPAHHAAVELACDGRLDRRPLGV